MTRYTPAVPRAREAAAAAVMHAERRRRRALGEARRRAARADVVARHLVDALLAPGATAEQRARLADLERATRRALADAP